MKKLPLSITSFEKIRDPAENYLYIDKTELAYQLINSGTYYFLSRPRRFGKSLFIDTLKSLFEGRKDLFQHLAISNKWDWNTVYPVIQVDFNTGDFKSSKTIENRIYDIFRQIQRDLDVNCENTNNIPSCFNELIRNIYEKHQQKVVILIDEYDKPILDNITNKSIALEARNILKSFYSVIKSNDQYIKFVFITGVSKFSKMNLFSGLNNLVDITTMSDYATICGYTHNDVKTHFKEHLKDVDLDKVKSWYNGYNYYPDCIDCSVYNPFDVLLFIANHYEYSSYWWETGTPSFLIEKLKEQNYYIPNLENIIVTKK
ncbi:MAG: AAA family ATPase [Gammaproteobacteria bacterium]|nr:AAA family ATPase [Gammaproteobacteria bacterium]